MHHARGRNRWICAATAPCLGWRRGTNRKDQISVMDLKSHIRGIADFPTPGILFYDISTLLRHAEAWRTAIDQLAERIKVHEPEMIFGIESRGFLVAAPVAYKLGCGCAMVRKKEKLPGETIAYTYSLEYGTDTIEIQADAAKAGQRIVMVDDLLATGGTMAAAISLLRRLNADVRGAACIVELDFLNGRSRLDVPFDALVNYTA
jgi:adenine phosphoribosyltransferase